MERVVLQLLIEWHADHASCFACYHRLGRIYSGRNLITPRMTEVLASKYTPFLTGADEVCSKEHV